MKAIGASLTLLAVIVGCSGDEELPKEEHPKTAEDAGGTIKLDGAPLAQPSCTDQQKNGEETDVDCGGSVCPPCANGRACVAKGDCASGVCATNVCATDTGCADGTREGFASPTTYPNIAACAGAWTLPGVLTTTVPACGRKAGNGGDNAAGTGCNVADLCQPSWHVCASGIEVMTKSGGTGCAGGGFTGGGFFAVRVSSSGGAICGAGMNDLFGCGDVGAAPDAASCAPLDRFSGDLCAALPATWVCGADGMNEANAVTKTAADGGGVLCCRD